MKTIAVTGLDGFLAGYVAALNYYKNHTYDVRVRQLLETIGFLKGPGLEKLHDKRKKWSEWAS